MEQLSWLFLHLYCTTCFRLCLSQLNISHFEKTISKHGCVASEVIDPRGRSMLFCASICGRYSQCVGYGFSEDGKCYIGGCNHVKWKKAHASSADTFIQKGAARCGVPPRHANAKVSYEGDVIITYTCDEDYRTFSNDTRTICKSTGEWDTVELGCRRYKWRNPKPNLRKNLKNIVFNETIPFWKEAKNIYVKVKGEPTKDRLFVLTLRHQSDILFSMSARFRWARDVKKIVLNTFKAGKWNREIRKTNFPFTVGKAFLLEITHSDGEYKVQVNDRDWLTIEDRYALIRPTSLTLCYDVYVKLVEMYYK